MNPDLPILHLESLSLGAVVTFRCYDTTYVARVDELDLRRKLNTLRGFVSSAWRHLPDGELHTTEGFFNKPTQIQPAEHGILFEM